MESTMGYMIAYRKFPQHPVEYHYEREFHFASEAAEAILLKKYELLEIQSTGDSYPLTRNQAFARRDAKAAHCKARGDNQYEREEAFAIERFQATHPSN
jgi:hypothetical protein